MNTKHKIDFQISGIGYLWIDATSRRDALEKFAGMDMRELAGWCEFSSCDSPSGIHIISIADEEFQVDLDTVRRGLEGEEAPCT